MTWLVQLYGDYDMRPGRRESFYEEMFYFRFSESALSAWQYNIVGSYSFVFEIPGDPPLSGENRRHDFKRNFIRALNAYIALHPDMTSDAWCRHTEAGRDMPYQWYAGGNYLAGTNRIRVFDAVTYDCPHCAFRAACARNNSLYIPVPIAHAIGSSIPEDWMPVYSSCVEIVGEDVPDSTATIKDLSAIEGVTCGQCGFLGHNVRTCQHTQKFYDMVGVELEGRYLDLRAAKNTATSLGATYSGDGSIQESPDSNASAYEFKTRPGTVRDACNQIIALYPDETDKSCGMHVHVSFVNPNYALSVLNTEAFFAYFQRRWTDWGNKMGLDQSSQFFRRLRGENDYCMINEYSSVMCDGERYQQLNFNAWGGHRTLECRLLPMFRRSSLAVAAVQELLSIYQDYLECPEAHGYTWLEAEAGVDSGYLVGVKEHSETFELDIPELQTHASTETFELAELPPVPEGRRRIALPANQPITVEALARRLAA